MRTQIFIMIASLMVLNILGCTREAKDAAKLNLTIASRVDGDGALDASTLQLGHVSINVSGAGITNPVVYSWDGCNDCSTPTTVPSSFQVTVPSGSGRLIQILAVYKDTNTSQMVFYYGDVTQDLNGGEVAANINVSNVGQGNITNGHVAGRYYNTATGGPTGLVDIKYNPGNNKPAMIVENSMIVNGWFSFFMLSGANLEYSVRDTKEVLWGKEVSLDSDVMDPAQNSGAYFDQRVKALIPVHVEQRNDNNVTTYTIQEPETGVWGYWGPGAVGKKICTSGLDSGTMQRLKQYAASSLSSAPALNINHYINWNLAIPAKATLADKTTPYPSVIFQGGSSMSTNCASFPDNFANQFTNFMKITSNLVDGNGGDSFAGFSGIFRNNSNNNFATINGDPKTISGQILPGVEEVFSGVRVFKRVSNEDYRLNIPKCGELSNFGFVAGSSSDGPFDATELFSVSSNITATEGTSGVTAVLCPLKNGSLAPFGVFMSKWNFNMGSGGMTGGPATKLALVSPQKTDTTGTIVNNVCTPVIIEARTASNTLGSLPGMVNINLSSADANTAFYNNSSCSGAVTLMQTGSSTTTVYVKRSVSGGSSNTLSVSATGLTSTPSTINYVDMPGTITPRLQINAPATIGAYECYPVSFESWNSNLYMVNFWDAYASNFSFSLPSIAGLAFYYNGDCQNTAMTSVNLGTNPQTIGYMKYTGNSTSLNIQPTSISPSTPILTSDIVGGNNISVVLPSVATTLDAAMPLNFEEGQCQMINVRSVDGNGRLAPTVASVTVNLSTTLSGTFYQYNGCSNPLASVSLSIGQTNVGVYFKAATPGTGTVTLSSSSPSVTITRNVTVTPATFSQIIIAMPGQTFVDGTGLTGTATAVPQNTASNMNIYLVKYDGYIDTNANGARLTGGSISGGTMASAATINFVNGHATNIPFTPDNSYSNVYISLQSGIINGSSASVSTYAAATMLNLYMSNSGALAPGGCQIMALISESADGASPLVSPTSFTISSNNGSGVYSDASCSVPANGTYSFLPTDHIMAFYFKQPTSSTSSAITVVPNNSIISTPLNVTTGSTATSSAYAFLFTGRMTSMKQSVCQPYLVSVADSLGRSVVIGADQAVNLQVNSGGGTVGTFDDASCDWPYSGAPTSITASSNFATVFLTAMISGSTHLLNASGSPLQSTTTSGIVPTP